MSTALFQNDEELLQIVLAMMDTIWCGSIGQGRFCFAKTASENFSKRRRAMKIKLTLPHTLARSDGHSRFPKGKLNVTDQRARTTLGPEQRKPSNNQNAPKGETTPRRLRCDRLLGFDSACVI